MRGGWEGEVRDRARRGGRGCCWWVHARARTVLLLVLCGICSQRDWT